MQPCALDLDVSYLHLLLLEGLFVFDGLPIRRVTGYIIIVYRNSRCWPNRNPNGESRIVLFEFKSSARRRLLARLEPREPLEVERRSADVT